MQLKHIFSGFVMACLLFLSCQSYGQVTTLNLNGNWQTGLERKYDKTTPVPGLWAELASNITPGTLWYKQTITLPKGDFSEATILLNGARFNPVVYINGDKVAEGKGGMAPISLLLKHPAIKSEGIITIEIALASLSAVEPDNASRIPLADRWRSNVSSCLWDNVSLRLHGPTQISRLIPVTDLLHEKLVLKYNLSNLPAEHKSYTYKAEIREGNTVVVAAKGAVSLANDTVLLSTRKLLSWTPDMPNLYKIHFTIQDGNKILDQQTFTYGAKHFATVNKQFELNGAPFHARGGILVWHRFVRDPEARTIAFDTTWFRDHVIRELKDRGANFMRFHLGTPPEAFLDLCDKYGLVVQFEWLFFHGMDAGPESLKEQWQSWLDLAARHPSVCIIHPWNETDPEAVKPAWKVLDQILPQYGPLVLADRNTLHIHKYWWSMFENLGLYYDSYKQFPEAIVADEFGGNYLDGNNIPGGYKTLSESFLRFLGKNHTPETRLKHHTISNSQVAEYWRRTDAAGFTPFCIAGSPEDGNHWYLGPLKDGKLKPVWNAMTAAWSPQAISLELWDRHFSPDEVFVVKCHSFNDTDTATLFKAKIDFIDQNGKALNTKFYFTEILAHGHKIDEIAIRAPKIPGRYRVEARITNQNPAIKYPAVSSWEITVLSPQVPYKLANTLVAVPDEEQELKAMLSGLKIQTTDLSDPKAKIWLLGKLSYDSLQKPVLPKAKPGLNKAGLEMALQKGINIVMLDAGPAFLGPGYYNAQIPYQAQSKIEAARTDSLALPFGLQVRFTELAEAESHIHPAGDGKLWTGLPADFAWLFNGLRGGLVAPAADMELEGLSQPAFLAQWQERGASPSGIKGKSYFAYELQGFYTFSEKQNDASAKKDLREKVKFLVSDAPALKNAINPEAPIRVINLSAQYLIAAKAKGSKLEPMAAGGKNLVRTPIVKIGYGPTDGKLLVSQLLTKGRLVEGFGEKGLYGIRYDPAAVQLVINMLKEVSEK